MRPKATKNQFLWRYNCTQQYTNCKDKLIVGMLIFFKVVIKFVAWHLDHISIKFIAWHLDHISIKWTWCNLISCSSLAQMLSP